MNQKAAASKGIGGTTFNFTSGKAVLINLKIDQKK